MKDTPKYFALLLPVAVLVSGCNRSEPTPPVATSSAPTSGQTKPIPFVNGDTLPQTSGKEEHHEDGEEPHHDHFMAEGALVTNHGIALFQETQASGGHSPDQRARIIAERLNRTAEMQGLDPKNIVALPANGLPTVSFAAPKGKVIVLATVDSQTASQFGYKSNPGLLAAWWRDVLRDHAAIIAGKPPLYTTPYSSALQKVYSLCQKEQKGVPTHESFEQALGKLSRDDHDELQGLYIQVPKNYRPQTN